MVALKCNILKRDLIKLPLLHVSIDVGFLKLNTGPERERIDKSALMLLSALLMKGFMKELCHSIT